MLLYVLRENLDVVGVVDTWISLIWNTKLQKAGTFELYVSATPRNKRFLQANRFLARSDIGKLMYINTIEEKEEDNGKTLTVSGYSAEGIFRKRMYPIWSKTIKHGDQFTIPQIFAALNPFGFKLNVGAIERLYTGDVSTGDLRTDMESYLRFLLIREGDEKLVDANFWQLPQTYTLEFDYMYPDDGLIFVPILLNNYKNTKPSHMFSEDIGNIRDVTYSYSEEGCPSAIIALINTSANIVVQQDTGEVDEYGDSIYNQINITWADLENTADLMIYKSLALDSLGSNEEIIYVDPVVTVSTSVDQSSSASKHVSFKPVPRDILQAGTKYAAEGQKEEYWITDSSKVVNTYYILDQKATLNAMQDAIDKRILLATENIQGTVNMNNLTAYNIGDIVVIRDNDRRVDIYKRIEEIEESFDNSGYQITPTFGEPLKTIFDSGYRAAFSLK